MNKRILRWIHVQFLLTILLFLVYILASLLGGYLGFWYFNSAIAYALVFANIFLFLVISTLFRARIEVLINRSFLLRIVDKQGPPLPIKRIHELASLEQYLRMQEFTVFAKQGTHTVFSRMKKDDIKKIFRGYILEVVVYIRPNMDEFYLDHVDECVQKLQDEAIKNKQKVEKILVTQIKKVTELDDDTKNKIKEIIFLRTQSGIISTINVGLHEASGKAILLYSDEYSPSMYYRYHIDQIKRMV